jgi:hypothetical protein
LLERDDLSLPSRRDMLHVRLHTPKHPGSASSHFVDCDGIDDAGAVIDRWIAYYINQARPVLF